MAILVTAALSLFLAQPVVAMAQEASVAAASEYEVKAAFVYNFAKFVDWPDQPERTVTFCVSGPDPAYWALVEVAHGRMMGGHELAIRHISEGEEAHSDCQVVFVAWREKKRSAAVLAALSDRAVLTVGQEGGFLSMGGIINLLVVDHKVRFEINLAAARKARLTISSKLLQLAANIQEHAGGGR